MRSTAERAVVLAGLEAVDAVVVARTAFQRVGPTPADELIVACPAS